MAVGGALADRAVGAVGGPQLEAQHGQGTGPKGSEEFCEGNFAKMIDPQDVALLVKAGKLDDREYRPDRR